MTTLHFTLIKVRVHIEHLAWFEVQLVDCIIGQMMGFQIGTKYMQVYHYRVDIQAKGRQANASMTWIGMVYELGRCGLVQAGVGHSASGLSGLVFGLVWATYWTSFHCINELFIQQCPLSCGVPNIIITKHQVFPFFQFVPNSKNNWHQLVVT